jgi:hypothetical protein
MAHEFIEDQVAFLHSQHVASLKTGDSELQVADTAAGEAAELEGKASDTSKQRTMSRPSTTPPGPRGGFRP